MLLIKDPNGRAWSSAAVAIGWVLRGAGNLTSERTLTQGRAHPARSSGPSTSASDSRDTGLSRMKAAGASRLRFSLPTMLITTTGIPESAAGSMIGAFGH